MSRFTEPELHLTFYGDGRLAAVAAEIHYEAGEKGSGRIITIPEGFLTDGASVPRILWSFLPPWGSKASKAAVLHDYLIVLKDEGTPHEHASTWTQIDREFRHALIALGIRKWHAYAIFVAVRLAGLFNGR